LFLVTAPFTKEKMETTSSSPTPTAPSPPVSEKTEPAEVFISHYSPLPFFPLFFLFLFLLPHFLLYSLSTLIAGQRQRGKEEKEILWVLDCYNTT
jgi:hypothetical protein